MLFTNYGVRNPKYDDGIPLSMEMFQRNSAKGMCAKCIGKGSTHIVYEDKIYGDGPCMPSPVSWHLGQVASSAYACVKVKSFWRPDIFSISCTQSSVLLAVGAKEFTPWNLELEKEKLISIIKNLVERGNTVIAVEHDANFINNADYIIDIGPDAGIKGGWKI